MPDSTPAPAVPFQVAIALTPQTPVPPAEGANFFHFAHVGSEVQMLVGTINLLDILHAQVQGGETVVSPAITHRFMLSLVGFSHLRSQLNEISVQLEAATSALKVGQ